MKPVYGFNQPDVQIEEIMLEKIKFGLSVSFSGSLRNSITMDTDWRIFSDDVIRRINFFLLGNKTHTEEKEVVVKTYPSTMWDELIEDYAPHWLKKIFPVRYSKDTKKVIYHNYKVCPHLDAPDRGKHIRWVISKEGR